MKNLTVQPTGNNFRFSILILVFLVNLIILGSCKRDRLIIDRGKSIDKYSYSTVLPPRPDTHLVERSTLMSHDEMEVDFTSLSMESENNAILMGENGEVLSTARIESYGKPDTVSNKPVYHKRAVFQLEKATNQPMLKVTLPTTSSPDSNETFFIKVQ